MFIEHGIHQHVNTNAVLFSEEIENGLKRKAMVVQVSVDAGTRETYKKIKGRDAFETVWNNISKYSRAGDVIGKYIIYDNNASAEDVRGFIDLCRINSVASVILSPEQQRNNAGAYSDETLRNVALMIHEARNAGVSIQMNPGLPFLPMAKSKIDECLKLTSQSRGLACDQNASQMAHS
jgi:sulfatase maturation enzyme AslB (radical SAM superfamily)